MTGERGRIVAGKYQLIEPVGEGGMAVVWRALMRSPAGWMRPVAAKRIKRELRDAENYVSMFIEEARVGYELAHPNIVQVFDFVTDEGGDCYLIMEWVEGLDLHRLARTYRDAGEPAPWPVIAAIAVDALQGLAAAHERRNADGLPMPIIHRDVSPQNILVGVDGSARLTDFGLARARDRIYSLTAPGKVKGKLPYLAPEVALGQRALRVSDLFSMGVVLWQALAGRRLFRASSDLELLSMIRACQVDPLDAERPDLPARLVSAIHRALHRDPQQRFGSAREMGSELDAVLDDAGVLDRRSQMARSVAVARQRLAAAAG